MANTLIPGLSEDQIDQLKKKHGNLTLITVGEDDDRLDFIFCKPSMNVMRAVASFGDRDPIGAAQAFFKNCIVHGDVKYADDVEVFMSIVPHLQELINEKKVVLKNL